MIAAYFLIALSFLMVGFAFSVMAGKWFAKDADAQASGVVSGILVMAAPILLIYAFKFIAEKI